MTLPRYQAICDHWARVPPLAVSAAAIAQSLGAMKPPAPPPKKAGEPKKEQDLAALFDMLGGAGFATKKPDWLKNG